MWPSLTLRYRKNIIKCNRLQLRRGQNTNRMFEWAVWVETTNESKGGRLFGPVTCQQINITCFIARKPEVYHFCLFSHACMRKHQPWSICPLPHALIWQFHPIMVRKRGGGQSLLWPAKLSRLSWPSDGCVRGGPSLFWLSWWSLWSIASEMFLCMCV